MDNLNIYFELKNWLQKNTKIEIPIVLTTNTSTLSIAGIENKCSVMAIIPAKLAPLLNLITTTYLKLKIKTLSQNSLKVP